MYKCMFGPASKYSRALHIKVHRLRPPRFRVMSTSRTPRNLVIRWRPSHLTRDVKLLLAFAPPGSTDTSAALVWKSVLMSADPGSQNLSFAKIDYTANFAFGACASGHEPERTKCLIPMNPDEKTQLGLSGYGNPIFSDPTKTTRPSTTSAATYGVMNVTGAREWINFGIISGSSSYHPVFAWELGHTMSISVKFHPILMAFVSYESETSGSVSAEFSSDVMWAQNLLDLPEDTLWDFEETPSGSYGITRYSDLYEPDVGQEPGTISNNKILQESYPEAHEEDNSN
jgi:hypothetical protein